MVKDTTLTSSKVALLRTIITELIIIAHRNRMRGNTRYMDTMALTQAIAN